MSDIDYEKSFNSPVPIFKPTFSNYSIFYFTISVCAVFFLFLILLNLILSCCSDYSEYWNDKFTGKFSTITFKIINISQKIEALHENEF